MVVIVDWTNINATGIAAELDRKVKPIKKAFVVSIYVMLHVWILNHDSMLQQHVRIIICCAHDSMVQSNPIIAPGNFVTLH